MGDSAEERQHWRDILRAFDDYMQYHVSTERAPKFASNVSKAVVGNSRVGSLRCLNPVSGSLASLGHVPTVIIFSLCDHPANPSQLAANHARRMAFLALPRDQREVYEDIGFRDKLEAVDEGIRQ
jgi:hypothetical protein